jgi:tetratricopeptide (TPR) repeat protein
VWFNAWRYEREEQFALIALMKTIAFAMGEHPIYKEIKPIILRGLEILTKGVLHKLATDYVMTEKEVDEFQKKLSPKMDFLSEVEKDTIYFDGVIKIEKELNRILRKYQNSRIVVFIDDLDRCSPSTVLQVFESIKVFLGIGGFIYVMGLSEQTISKFITAEYEKSGIKDKEYIKRFGEQYTGKIIQIPIRIPEWNTNDIQNLIKNLCSRLEEKHSRVVSEKSELISSALDLNPREVKRFINNFIIAAEIFSINSIIPEQLIVVQALKDRWREFYAILSSDSKFRDFLSLALGVPYEIRRKVLNSEAYNTDKLDISVQKKVTDFSNLYAKSDQELKSEAKKIESNLWSLLEKEKDTIFGIDDWELYRRAVSSVKKRVTDKEEGPEISSNQWYQEALALYDQKRYSQAIAKTEEALRSDRNNFAAYNLKGAALDKMGRYVEAISNYNMAIDKKPDYVNALYNRAIALDSLGKSDEAKISFELTRKLGSLLTLEEAKTKSYTSDGIIIHETLI